MHVWLFFFFQAEDGIRDKLVTGVQTCALPICAAVSGLGMLLLVLIWALSEYHNAGGWPVHGFSQSPGLHDVWNLWIIYPLGAWLVMLAAGGWDVYLRKPISEQQIRREIERQAGTGK